MEEINLIRKAWRGDYLRIALVYPNAYTAMAGLTIQTLYSLWNSFPNVICERFFLPSETFSPFSSQYTKKTSHHSSKKKNNSIYSHVSGDNRDYLNSSHPAWMYPQVRSLENQMPLSEFDIIAFTVSYELDYSNMVWFLDNAHIPIQRNERRSILENNAENSEEKYFPLVIAGGPVIRSNPLPISPMLDIAFVGEIEVTVDQMINSWFQAVNDTQNKNYFSYQQDFLSCLKKIPGFWVIQDENLNPPPKITRVYVKDLDLIPHPIHQIIPRFPPSQENVMPFGEAIFIEVNRGCPHNCRFCMTGAQLKPFRNRSLLKLKEIISMAIQATGVQKVVLIGSSVTEHPNFVELCQFLIENRLEFSIPSIRIESTTEQMVKYLGKSGMKTIAIAPETGTDSLRKILNKSIKNPAIIVGTNLLLSGGVANIKLYLLYGVPGEKKEDLEGIVSLAEEIAALGYGKLGVRLSVNPFIPKAHTTFQIMLDEYLDPKMTRMRSKI